MTRAPRAPRAGAAGLLLAAAGLAGIGLGSVLPGASAELVGGNVPVNAGATDRLDPTGHNSPTVVVNPRDAANLAVVNRVDAPRFACALHVSFDGGATWAATPVPGRDSATVGCFSPDVAFGADGTLHLAFTSFDAVPGSGTIPDALWVARSGDGGRTLSAPTRAAGPGAFQVRLGAHPARPGRLYLTWVQATATAAWGFAEAGNPVVVATSDDGGASWGPPAPVSATSRSRVVAPALAVGAGDDVYVAYLDAGEDRLDYHGGHEGRGGDPYPGRWSLVVARSDDGGRRWQESVADGALVPTRRFLILFPPAPSLALDARSGRLYAAFADGGGGDADVVVWRSGDGGRRWERLVVGGEAGGAPRTQYLPALAVAPNGRLDVVYYDRRSDPDDVLNHVSLQSSGDGGRSFAAPLRLSEQPFDSGIGFGRQRQLPELGSRLGLLATDAGALAVWADTRAGEHVTGKQDLARALVAIAGPHPWRQPLRRGGGLLVVVGLVVVASGLLSARRRQAPGAGPEPQPPSRGEPQAVGPEDAVAARPTPGGE